MKILFQSRIDLFDRRGGDTVQMERTAAELEKLGVAVDIDCSPEKDLSGYALVHLFNIDWPANVYLCAKNAQKQGKSIVFSPIHHSFEEIERYERKYRFGLRRFVNAVFKRREAREKFKDFCRALADPKKITSTVFELKKGVMEEQRELLGMSDAILVQTEAEVRDIVEDFGVSMVNPSGVASFSSRKEEKRRALKGATTKEGETHSGPFVFKVVNGVDRRFVEASRDWFVGKYGWEDFVLCVGRIEPRKNQLAVAEAMNYIYESCHSGHDPESDNPIPRQILNHLDCTQRKRVQNDASSEARPIPQSQAFGSVSKPGFFPRPGFFKLIFVGKLSWRHPEYALRFKRLVKKYDWIKHIERIPYENMGSAYAAAKVHISASWFETTGLVSLEAGLAGCNVVAAGDRAREYLGDYAFYCDPGDPRTINEAVEKAYSSEVEPGFREHILKNFTWDKTAEQTLEVYECLLG